MKWEMEHRARGFRITKSYPSDGGGGGWQVGVRE